MTGPARTPPTWSETLPGVPIGKLGVGPALYVGDSAACRPGGLDLSVVHACKAPCHQLAVGYRGSLPADHEHYLVLRRPHELFLNLIDPPVPLFKRESFDAFLAFARAERAAGNGLLIHCNRGESRAPALAMLLLATEDAMPAGSYAAAAEWFTATCYRHFAPGAGLAAWLHTHWSELMETWRQ